jgi:hypothetical protein
LHCLVKLNTTHVFLTGGLTGSGYSAASYIFSSANGFVKQADMISTRSHHACSLHSDNLVFVTGGYTGSAIKTTEYFSLTTLRWLPGPDLPSPIYGGQMISVQGKTLFIGGRGNKKIFKLNKLHLSTVDWWEWVEVAETKTARYYFDVIKMNIDDCKYCNN